jgi:hypothetical protein
MWSMLALRYMSTHAHFLRQKVMACIVQCFFARRIWFSELSPCHLLTSHTFDLQPNNQFSQREELGTGMCYCAFVFCFMSTCYNPLITGAGGIITVSIGCVYICARPTYDGPNPGTTHYSIRYSIDGASVGTHSLPSRVTGYPLELTRIVLLDIRLNSLLP